MQTVLMMKYKEDTKKNPHTKAGKLTKDYIKWRSNKSRKRKTSGSDKKFDIMKKKLKKAKSFFKKKQHVEARNILKKISTDQFTCEIKKKFYEIQWDFISYPHSVINVEFNQTYDQFRKEERKDLILKRSELILNFISKKLGGKLIDTPYLEHEYEKTSFQYNLKLNKF